jgi:integrase
MAWLFKRDSRGPYLVRWYDELGRVKERSSKTTDRRAAERIAVQIQANVSLRREGVVDPALAMVAEESQRPLQEHVDDYLAHLERGRRSPRTIADARQHLGWLRASTRATRLSDLTLDKVERALGLLQAENLSARTFNHKAGSARSFLNWAVKAGRLERNPLRHLPHQSEAQDRRRERRPLDDDELERLFEVARSKGRELWYALAYWAGLRLSELKRLAWEDLDLARGVLVVSQGKARRVDEVPVHPELVRLLEERGRALRGPVFPTAVTNATRVRDFARAGIGTRDGRVADLHSLRVTLATNLARAGVQPQVAQRLLRHSDYRTTVRFYTKLSSTDTRGALAQLRVPHAKRHLREHGSARDATS